MVSYVYLFLHFQLHARIKYTVLQWHYGTVHLCVHLSQSALYGHYVFILLLDIILFPVKGLTSFFSGLSSSDTFPHLLFLRESVSLS